MHCLSACVDPGWLNIRGRLFINWGVFLAVHDSKGFLRVENGHEDKVVE